MAACLAWLDRFRHLASWPEEVELALWFHDAVYQPGGEDNETRSAELARAELGRLGVGRAAAARIAHSVEATRDHGPAGGDAALVVDLDLAILAAWPRDFDRFEHEVRAECAAVPEPLYRAGRSRVLQRLSSRPAIYQLPEIRAKLEAPARANLQRRIGALSRRRP